MSGGGDLEGRLEVGDKDLALVEMRGKEGGLEGMEVSKVRSMNGQTVVWCGVVWCGVVWCGVVWCGVALCCVVLCGVVWCGLVWCGLVWCGLVSCGVL